MYFHVGNTKIQWKWHSTRGVMSQENTFSELRREIKCLQLSLNWGNTSRKNSTSKHVWSCVKFVLYFLHYIKSTVNSYQFNLPSLNCYSNASLNVQAELALGTGKQTPNRSWSACAEVKWAEWAHELWPSPCNVWSYASCSHHLTVLLKAQHGSILWLCLPKWLSLLYYSSETFSVFRFHT